MKPPPSVSLIAPGPAHHLTYNLQTPTPRRFLNKRPTPSQLPQSTPTPMRFQSTPRFGSTQSATRQVEDVEDIDIDSSQSQSQSQSAAAHGGLRLDGRDGVSDSIEVGSYAESDSSPSQLELQSGEGSDHVDAGSLHRRKDVIEEDDEGDATVVYMATEGSDEEEIREGHGTPPLKRRKLSPSASPPRQQVPATDNVDADGSQENYQSNEEDDVQDRARTRAPVQQPTFRTAPRFKPAPEDETSATNPDGHYGALLAPAFSPQRRRAKYIPGGLAMQLQGLLSQVKGSESLGDARGGALVRLVVEEIRPGTRMHLIEGKILSRGAVAEAGDFTQRYILAGSHDRRVQKGSVLRIMGTPAWDVHLGEKWTVACDWSVESLEGLT